FLLADVEALPFLDLSLDSVMLSCLLHHLPNPALCAKDVFRVLKPGGRFVAFDPNRLNPFMYLYRDRSSPFYSPKGVTPNERPVLAYELRKTFSSVGFEVTSQFVDGLTYRYVASDTAKGLLPIYNMFERFFFKPQWLSHFRSFVFTVGQKVK
ncbi:MAG: methyltransferase domain-containing protein, partial [Candidatus Berkiella sp.]